MKRSGTLESVHRRYRRHHHYQNRCPLYLADSKLAHCHLGSPNASRSDQQQRILWAERIGNGNDHSGRDTMVSDKGTTRRAWEGGIFEEQRGGRCRAGDSVIRGYERRKRTRARLTCISNGLKSYHKRCFFGRKGHGGAGEARDGVRCRERERGLRQRRQRDREIRRHIARDSDTDRATGRATQSGRDGERRKEGESGRGGWG